MLNSNLSSASSGDELPAKPARKRNRWELVFWFAAVVAVVFALRTWPFWQNGELLAGTHADGAYRYTMELLRLQPDLMPEDPTIKANRDGGFYENFYRPICWLAARPGWDLFRANYAVCWLGNALFLAGMMFLLARLGLVPWACALGTFLAAQPFALVRVAVGVTHSLAIPREVWFWPVPWFLAWFIAGPRTKGHLILFYGALGLVFGWTYPLTAVWFGLAAGLADVWLITREKRYRDFGWLAGSAAVCLALISPSAMAMAHLAGSEETATVDFLQNHWLVYQGKGFRRFAIFAAIAFWAFWRMRRNENWAGSIPARRLWALWVVSLVVSVAYQPLEYGMPFVSLLFLGRLSLLNYVIGMVAVAACLHFNFRGFSWRGKSAVIIFLLIVTIDPVRVANQDRQGVIPLQPGFVEFCRAVKASIPTDALAIVPPGDQADYFRVYAERGLWADRHDRAVLMNVRAIYKLSLERSEVIKKFYAPNTTASERESLLARMKGEGLDYVVTRDDAGWTRTLSWPVTMTRGMWQLRAAIKIERLSSAAAHPQNGFEAGEASSLSWR